MAITRSAVQGTPRPKPVETPPSSSGTAPAIRKTSRETSR